jgi:CP family cyanate transporter-like MFS transporter
LEVAGIYAVVTYKTSIVKRWNRGYRSGMSRITFSKKWFGLASCWLSIFSLYANMMCVPPILEMIKSDLAMSSLQAGLLLSTPVMVIAVLAVPGGFISDRMGLRRMLGLALASAALGGLLRGFSSSFPTLLLSTFIFALGFTLGFLNMPRAVKAWFPPSVIRTVTGAYTTGVVLGSSAGLALTRFLVSSLGGTWQTAFYIWGFIALLPAGLWWVMKNEPLTIRERQRISDKTLKIFKRLMLDRTILVAAIMLFMLNADFYGLIGWLPTYLASMGLDPIIAGSTTALITLAELLGILLIPFASERIGVRKLFFSALFFAIAIISPLIPYALSTKIVLWLLLLILGASMGGIFSLILALPAETAEPEVVGAATGVILSIGYAGGVSGPLITGFLKDVTGTFLYSFFAFGAMAFIALASSLLLQENLSSHASGSRKKAN